MQSGSNSLKEGESRLASKTEITNSALDREGRENASREAVLSGARIMDNWKLARLAIRRGDFEKVRMCSREIARLHGILSQQERSDGKHFLKSMMNNGASNDQKEE
jgi:hypothetical protein